MKLPVPSPLSPQNPNELPSQIPLFSPAHLFTPSSSTDNLLLRLQPPTDNSSSAFNLLLRLQPPTDNSSSAFNLLLRLQPPTDNSPSSSTIPLCSTEKLPALNRLKIPISLINDVSNSMTIQQRSNSLATYELLEILHSKAEVIEGLKLRRGSKEEKYKVEVHKNLEGNFHLNQMQEEM